MADHVLLGDLASVFQLAAGVALAMSVFRAPYERRYHRLGAILDREEIILRGREDENALVHGDKVVAARALWLAKGREIEPLIARHESWIWGSVSMACVALVVVSLYANCPVSRAVGAGLVVIVAAPLLWGSYRISLAVRDSLSGLSSQIAGL